VGGADVSQPLDLDGTIFLADSLAAAGVAVVTETEAEGVLHDATLKGIYLLFL
jgi:hypothetical protein